MRKAALEAGSVAATRADSDVVQRAEWLREEIFRHERL
jgi:hypothetical protein